MFKNKCAIVTGGANGIGEGIVRRLVALNCKVVIGDIDEVKGNRLVEELNRRIVNFVKCDVSKEHDLKMLFHVAQQEFNGFQILVNNAGIAVTENIESTTEQIAKVVDINLKSTIYGTSLAVQQFLKEREAGSTLNYTILNISSASAITPLASLPIYSATKAGVLAFTTALEYLGAKGIHVNCILPTYVETDLIKPLKNAPYFAASLNDVGGFLPLSKLLDSAIDLMQDESKSGKALILSPKLETFYRDLSEEYQISGLK